jgi:hypothetical protein
MRFEINAVWYYSRRLASTERAAADLFHYNPQALLDNPGFINQEKLREIQEELGYAIHSSIRI